MGKQLAKKRSERMNLFLLDQYFNNSSDTYDIRHVGRWVLVKQKSSIGNWNVAIWKEEAYAKSQRALKGLNH